MGKLTRIPDMTRAQAISYIARYRQHKDKDCTTIRALFEEARAHKNYHVRVAAWKARGCPMPSTGTHEGNLVASEDLAKDLQPNQVARYFKQQDAELQESLARISSDPTSSEENIQRAKDFTNVCKQQYVVSLLGCLSGKEMW